MSRFYTLCFGTFLAPLAAATMIGCSASETTAIASDDSSQSSSGKTDDLFTVPQGSADDLLNFIQKLASPEPFKSEADMNAYKEKASRAIGAAADRALTKEVTDEQATEAIGWKLESLKIMGELGDAQATDKADKYLTKLADDKRPAIRAGATRVRFQVEFAKWDKQDETQRLKVLEQYAKSLKSNGLTQADAEMLLKYGDLCSGIIFPTTNAPARVFKELLPQVRDSKDAKVAALAPEIEASIRRLELPGQKLAIEGNLFDGKELDWNSYRGKTVLIDFWASDCSECIAEVPNLVRLYRGYHDKGFEIIGVNLDHDRAVVTELLKKSNITWPQLFDDNPSAGHWEHPLAKKYDVDALPRMILVDKDGTVIHMNARGPLLASELKRLLGEPAVALDAEIPKTVPDGTPAEIMAFMEDTLQKLPAPRSRQDQLQNLEKVRTLLGIAGEKILAGEPTLSQASEAIQMKLASLRASTPAGVSHNQVQEAFLTSLESSPKPAVVGALAEFRLMQAISRWEDLSQAERTTAVEKYLPFAKIAKPSADQLRIASNLAMMSSETGDMALAKKLIDAMLAAYKDRSDPQVAKWAIVLEGIGRRADLVGKPFELDGTFLDGSKFDWESYRGKIVLVDFWASWCEPCRAEMPNIYRNYQAYRDLGFEVIGVSLDDERQPAMAFLKEAGIPWPSLFSSDPAATGFDSPVAVRYGITSIPVTILVDRDGKVVTTMARGPLLEQNLKKLLNK